MGERIHLAAPTPEAALQGIARDLVAEGRKVAEHVPARGAMGRVLAESARQHLDRVRHLCSDVSRVFVQAPCTALPAPGVSDGIAQAVIGLHRAIDQLAADLCDLVKGVRVEPQLLRAHLAGLAMAIELMDRCLLGAYPASSAATGEGSRDGVV